MTVILILLIAAVAQQSERSLIVEDLGSASTLIDNPQFTVLVVEIVDPRVIAGTNAHPPEGKFRVLEVLRGRNVEPGVFEYRKLTVPAEARDQKLWNSQPLVGPAQHDRLIVFTYVGSQRPPAGSLIVLQGPMIRDTPELRAKLVKRLKHDSPFQIPLALVILISPFLALRKRQPWLSAPVALIAYAAYESTISIYYDIRVDLLILLPVVAVSVLLPMVIQWKRG